MTAEVLVHVEFARRFGGLKVALSIVKFIASIESRTPSGRA
jgi:hypothetical protein